MGVEYPYHHLPQDFHQYYPTEIPVSLWDQDDGLPVALLRKVIFSEDGLDQTGKLLPEGGVGFFLSPLPDITIGGRSSVRINNR